MDVEKRGIKIVCFLYSHRATRALGRPPQRVFHNNAESLIKLFSCYSELSLCHVVGRLFLTGKKKSLRHCSLNSKMSCWVGFALYSNTMCVQ